MSQRWCSALPGGVRLALQISANGKKTEVVGLLDDVLKLRLQAQPIDGKANAALIRFLADTLGLPKSAIRITHGKTSQRKLLYIASATLTPEALASALLGLLPKA